MPLHDLTEFLKLSSVLNYNLSAASLSRYNVLLFIIENKSLDIDSQRDKDAKSIVMEALGFLFAAYSHKRRRLEPMAVIHPIRAAALFARARNRIGLVELLSALFHDILEDIQSVDFEVSQWIEMESLLYDILQRLEPEREEQLIHNLLHLTQLEGESYYRYIGRLLDNAGDSTDLIQIKLADCLDNTLDMRIDLQDLLEGIDFFENIFQILYVPNYRGKPLTVGQPTSTVLNGASRLYQLFKNAVLLSLIRQKIPADRSPEFEHLFDAVCSASLKEAQRTFIHLVHYRYRDTAEQRQLLLETMDYCHRGRIDLVTKPDTEFLLDGLFSGYFGFAEKKTLDQRLHRLYQNKPLMIEATIAFITIFLSFMNDPDFFVRGISDKGIEPT